MLSSYTLAYFNNLPLTDKIILVEEHATYTELKHSYGLYDCALFLLDSLYIEVRLNKKTDTIEQVKAFTSYKRLDFYIGKIDITPICLML